MTAACNDTELHGSAKDGNFHVLDFPHCLYFYFFSFLSMVTIYEQEDDAWFPTPSPHPNKTAGQGAHGAFGRWP